jgi:all-trans-retinol dehydrogenase (NAD+)
MKNLQNKKILITGAGSGIGKLLSMHFADEGAVLILLDINKDNLDKVSGVIKNAGKEAFAYRCDVSDKNAVYNTARKIKRDIGKIDILVNNAGVVSGKPFLKCTDDEIIRTMNVNIISHFWTVRAFLPDMIKADSGHIVTISSAAGLIGVSSLADYCASKFAAFGFNESIRMELRKQKIKGVKTTCVCPFYIDTGMFDGVKSRFAFILPIYKEKKAALKIFKAIKKERPLLKMPWIVNTIPVLRLLPASFLDFTADLLGISSSMDEFRGRAVKKIKAKKYF